MTEDKTCKTCIDNDNGFCDRKGILVEDDDHCSSWNVFTDKGVAMKRDVYALLQQTGLCCMLAR